MHNVSARGRSDQVANDGSVSGMCRAALLMSTFERRDQKQTQRDTDIRYVAWKVMNISKGFELPLEAEHIKGKPTSYNFGTAQGLAHLEKNCRNLIGDMWLDLLRPRKGELLLYLRLPSYEISQATTRLVS